MTAAQSPQTLITAAEEAAAAGQHADAERLLREAAALQEATLGPLHPDLANTLNNLGIVCEIADNPVDAEHYFRRACAIAVAALPPDHPFVATSRKNLEDFCAARGKPVKLPGADSLAVTGGPIVRASDQQAAAKESEPLRPAQPAAGRRTPVRTFAAVAIAAVAILLVTIAVTEWPRADDRSGETTTAPMSSPPPPATTTAPVNSPPRAAATPAPAPTSSSDAAAAGAPAQTTGVRSGEAPILARDQAIAAPASPRNREVASSAVTTARAAPVVAAAQLCRELSTGTREWRCVPPELPLEPGRLFFYTRVKSPVPVTVQHRWYRDGRVHQGIDLRIAPNTLDGYRTYSRTTVPGGASGAWRVELRTPAGVVLHEERFDVR